MLYFFIHKLEIGIIPNMEMILSPVINEYYIQEHAFLFQTIVQEYLKRVN